MLYDAKRKLRALHAHGERMHSRGHQIAAGIAPSARMVYITCHGAQSALHHECHARKITPCAQFFFPSNRGNGGKYRVPHGSYSPHAHSFVLGTAVINNNPRGPPFVCMFECECVCVCVRERGRSSYCVFPRTDLLSDAVCARPLPAHVDDRPGMYMGKR